MGRVDQKSIRYLSETVCTLRGLMGNKNPQAVDEVPKAGDRRFWWF
jgi:hypothetical protein